MALLVGVFGIELIDYGCVKTTNDTYTVSKLLALPDRLRADPTRKYTALCDETWYLMRRYSPSARCDLLRHWLRSHSYTYTRARMALRSQHSLSRNLYICSPGAFEAHF